VTPTLFCIEASIAAPVLPMESTSRNEGLVSQSDRTGWSMPRIRILLALAALALPPPAAADTITTGLDTFV